MRVCVCVCECVRVCVCVRVRVHACVCVLSVVSSCPDACSNSNFVLLQYFILFCRYKIIERSILVCHTLNIKTITNTLVHKQRHPNLMFFSPNLTCL